MQVLQLDAIEALEPEKREQAKLLLAQFEAAIAANPLLRYNNRDLYPDKVHEKQLAFHADKSRTRAVLGGNRSGKTYSAIVDDIIQAIDEDVVPDHLRPYKRWQPPFRCRIMAADFQHAMEVVIYEQVRQWVPYSQLVGGSWKTAFDKQQHILRFANGSWFQFMTYEQHVDMFRGAELERCHYDEEPPEDIYKENRKRLFTTRGDTIFSMTPEKGFTGIMTRILNSRHDDGVSVRHFTMFDNPWNSPADIEEFTRGMTEEEIRAAVYGEVVHFAGLVLSEWTNDCIVPQIEAGSLADSTVIVGIDPGIRFTGLVWIAFDKEDNALVFDSLKLENHTVDRVCEEIRKKNARWNVKPIYSVIDPSARNRTATNAESVEGEYIRHGIPTVHGQNDLETGVFQIKRRLANGSLQVTANNHALIDEIEHYRFDPKADEDVFAVIRVNNHIIDAVRYVLMSRPHVGPVRKTRVGNKNPYGALRHGIAPAYTGEPRLADNPYI